MTKQEMLAFVQAAVEASGTIDSVAVLTENRNAAVRFGQNRITQNMDVFRRELQLTVGDGKKQATVTSQRIDLSALAEIASEARSLLNTSTPDPEYMPPVEGGQVYPIIDEAWDEFTAGCPAAPRMETVGKLIDTAGENNMKTAGICWMLNNQTAVATSTGNLAAHRYTSAGLSFTMDRGLASSRTFLKGTAWAELEVDPEIQKVVEQVKMDENATDVPPGDYKLILEPQATWNLLMFLPWIMSARLADEGTSVFSGMEGKKITGENFSLSSSLYGTPPAIPFNTEGLPSRDVVWIEKGVLKNLPCDRFTAQKTGRPPLFVPETMGMAGGEGSVEDLVAGVDRGILIRRFWYIRFVDQKTLKLTGMTRDGVFLVENGKIVKPLKDFRWNWRPLELFSRILNVGKPVQQAAGMIPPVVIAEQHYPFTD
ncbi:MAG: TldD/PmbA family protein [Candidatus Fermentibacteraceae bacterium]|nr:TldD/PmbA family protein [Candidatus Fermentibacteraceae bacterium]